jgi:peptidoglycan/LPS O-acetylase OafA/YrhL
VRYDYLDSSRGIAATAVMLAHFQLTVVPLQNNSPFFKSPLAIITDGQSAILYFFILSGFVLTMSLKKNEEFSLVNYMKFIVSRIFRIFPAFIFTLLFTFLIINFFKERPGGWISQFWNEQVSTVSLITQSFLIKRIPNESVLRLIPQDWTLTIEIAISFLLPLLAYASWKNSVLLLITVYGAVKFLSLDPFVFDFSCGIFIAVNKTFLQQKWQTLKWKGVILIAALLLICADYLFPAELIRADVLLIHHKSWGLVIFLWALISSRKIQKVFSTKPLVFLGRISYSFYLLHLILLMIVAVIFPESNPAILFLIYFAVTIAFSFLIFKTIEIPFIRMAKRLS